MLAKHKRRRFAQRLRGSVYRTYATASESELRNPIVFVLDLRDRLACELAHAVMSGEQLAERIEADTHGELNPLLVFAVSPLEAAQLVGGRCKRLGDRLLHIAPKNRFRMVVVGYGGITCTKLSTAVLPKEPS